MKSGAPAAVLALALCGSGCTSQPESGENTKPAQAVYRVEHDKFGQNVIFQTISTDAPATLFITCKNGMPDRLTIQLDDAPPSPPPLAGNFGSFRFPHEPKVEIEMSFFPQALWSPRAQGTGDEKQIVARFFQGNDLSFTLPKPYGPGVALTWTAPRGDAQSACSSKAPNPANRLHIDH